MRLFIVFLLFATFVGNVESLNIYTAQRRLNHAAKAFLKSFYPGICAQVILNETVRRQYLSPQLTGRVQPVGTFPTTELALEYLYGLLCSIPNLPARRETVEKAHLLQAAYGSRRLTVGFKIRLDLVSKKQLVFVGSFAFDKKFKICGYEAVIQNLGLTLDFPMNTRPAYINGLCQGTQNICPAGTPLEQYASFNECVAFLSPPNKEFGSYDRGDQDNVVCRLIHLQLAQIAPELHCPHLGKTGGGACTNKPASWYFEPGNDDFLGCAYCYR